MIDTVIIRVHNLERNRHLVNNLDNVTTKGYETEIGDVPTSYLKKLNEDRVKNPSTIVEVLKFKSKINNTGRFVLKTKVGKHVNLSSHYMLTYFINYSKDYVEFNFSIPKYIYGTNVFLFGRHQQDKGYMFHNASTLEYNIDECYDLLMNFLKRFFHWEFIMCTVKLTDIEINRIDVCFNQVFKNKEEALRYLEYQKRLKKKYARDEEGVMRGYETSLMYTTNRYSAKIYHKGSEYEKHDKKEHLKHNKEKKDRYFKTDKLQNFADRILRYELTIRNRFLNDAHKRHIFRKKDKTWKELYTEYLLVEAIKQKNDHIAKKIGSISDPKKKLEYMAKHPYTNIDSKGKLAHKIVSKIISRSRKFMLDTDFDSHVFNEKCVQYNDDYVLFSKKLLGLCLEKLMEFVKEFQIKELPNEEAVRERIKAYNDTHTNRKLPENEMMNFYAHLTKHGSFKDAFKFCSYSRATQFRYKERFKLIGIDDKNITPAEKTFGIPKASLDLRAYHIHINDNGLMRGIRVTEASRI